MPDKIAKPIDARQVATYDSVEEETRSGFLRTLSSLGICQGWLPTSRGPSQCRGGRPGFGSIKPNPLREVNLEDKADALAGCASVLARDAMGWPTTAVFSGGGEESRRRPPAKRLPSASRHNPQEKEKCDRIAKPIDARQVATYYRWDEETRSGFLRTLSSLGICQGWLPTKVLLYPTCLPKWSLPPRLMPRSGPTGGRVFLRRARRGVRSRKIG